MKIDKSFIDGVGAPNGDTKELTDAIVELGKTLNLELVAEGIERSEQLAGLQSMVCELGQGFYFAEPLAASDVDALFALSRHGLPPNPRTTSRGDPRRHVPCVSSEHAHRHGRLEPDETRKHRPQRAKEGEHLPASFDEHNQERI